MMSENTHIGSLVTQILQYLTVQSAMKFIYVHLYQRDSTKI